LAELDEERLEETIWERRMNIATHESPAWIAKANFIIQVDLASHGLPDRREQLWSRKKNKYQFEVCCIPFFTYGINLGDIVETQQDYAVSCVVRKSGHKSLRIAILVEDQRDEIHIVLHNWAANSGLLYEWYKSEYLAVDLPPDIEKLNMLHLEALEQEEKISIEVDH
jgi:hypothetical protein